MPEKDQDYERPDSIQVNRTSTGKYSFKVKRYYDFSQDDPEKVIDSMNKIYEKLRKDFLEVNTDE